MQWFKENAGIIFAVAVMSLGFLFWIAGYIASAL